MIGGIRINISDGRWASSNVVRLVYGWRCCRIPDSVFALEYTNQNGQMQRAYCFLEADRGTMPVVRKGLAQTSFFRKLLAYQSKVSGSDCNFKDKFPLITTSPPTDTFWE